MDNQFGRQTLTLGAPRILAVPTTNLILTPGNPVPPPPPLPSLDHYKCYDACGKPIGDRVRLRDLYQTVDTKVLEPAFFCNPVGKLHNGAPTLVQNPNLHLTCYTIHVAPFQALGPVSNQFNPNTVVLGGADLLCAPTRKLSWDEAAPAVVLP